MDSSLHGITPLRQRMIDDMRMRKFADKTQSQYIRAVRQLAAFLGRSPDTATVEDLRRYQLHLVDHGTSPVSLKSAITGLKFFFEATLDQGELMAKMDPVRVPRTLPVVLSRDEVARLLAATRNLKHQTALSVAYGAGLRVDGSSRSDRSNWRGVLTAIPTRCLAAPLRPSTCRSAHYGTSNCRACRLRDWPDSITCEHLRR